LSVASNVGWLEISDRSLIDDSCRDLPRGDKVAGPLRGVAVDIRIERRRQRLLEHERAAIDAEKTRRRAAIAHVNCEVTRDHGLGCARRRR